MKLNNSFGKIILLGHRSFPHKKLNVCKIKSSAVTGNFVSIIVPAYNCEKTIARCLDSILLQDYPSYEVIVVDDLSTDGSACVIENYLHDYDQDREHPLPTFFFINPLKGKAKAINFALTKSSGDIIFIAESDAYYAKDYLSKLVSALEDDGVGGAIGRLNVPNKDKSHLTKTASLEREKKFRNYKPISAWVIKRNALEDVGGFDLNLRAHDEVMVGRELKKLGFKIAYVADTYWYHNEKEGVRQLWDQQMWWGAGYVDTLRYYHWVPMSIPINTFLMLTLFVFVLPYYLFLVIMTKSFSVAALKLLRGLFQTIGFWRALL